jgi:phosphatidylinositol-3-phosphatase
VSGDGWRGRLVRVRALRVAGDGWRGRLVRVRALRVAGGGWRGRLVRVRALRVAGTPLLVLVVLSLTSTGLVVVAALAGGEPDTVLAALAQRGVVVHRPAAARASAASVAAPVAGDSAAAGDASASTGPTGASGGGSGSGGDDGAAGDGGGDAGGDDARGDTPAQAPATTPAAPATPAAPQPKGTKVGHVFVISLVSSGYDATFGPAAASSWLQRELVSKGTLLTQYATLDDAELPNAIALVSGQPPNPQTQAGCATYGDVPASAKPDATGAIAGPGCVYPVTTLTLADQLGSAGKRWRAYVQGTGTGKTCRHPAAGAADPTAGTGAPDPADPYATRRNPFVYFHSLLDLGDCATNDADLGALGGDLAREAGTPNLVYVAPDRCHDGSSDPCAPGQPGGAAAADAFLAAWAPKILASPAYEHDGVLIVTFDALRPAPATAAATRRVGALLVSRWTTPASTDATPGDPDALLRTIEDLFGLRHLARAGGSGVHSYAPLVLG